MSIEFNQRYKRINATGDDVFIPLKTENNFVIFDSGAHCSIDTFEKEFILDINDINISSITEQVINPDTFFDTPISENDPLLDQLANIQKGTTIDRQIKDEPSIDLTNNTEIQPAVNNILQRTDVFNEPKEIKNRLPEWDMFDRVKKDNIVELEIPIKIKLPRAQKIDTLNDMFETSFTSYIAKEFINKNYTDNSGLMLLIKQAIDEWVENELNGTKTKRKPKRIVKQTPIKTTEIKTTEIKSEGQSASELFGQPLSNIKFDINSITLITNQEEYILCEEHLEKLLNANTPNNKLINKYKDMIETYTVEYGK